MAELTKEIYLQYAKKIVSVLKGDEFFNQYKKRVDEGHSSFQLVKKRLLQDISIDWIATIEDCLPNLDAIVRNPRRFIVQEEDIVDVSLARAISTESIKHLAQHTNMISKVDKDGTVTPSRILNITKEESFEIYENRFIYTLLLKLKDFVAIRYDKIKKATATQDVLQLNADSKFNLPSKKVTYRTEFMAQLSYDEIMRLDPETLDKIERVAKIDRIITDFLSSPFAKSMRNSAPVRPPITRTNVILKEPNFKKALTLWQFVETYKATAGFSQSDDIEPIEISDSSTQDLTNMVTLNTMLFESLYDQHETDMDVEGAQFTDLLTIGDLDFGKDEIQHDEFAQKVDEEEQAEESDKEQEIPPEKTEEPEPEIQPEEVILEVEKEKDKEIPPKELPEDEEPDVDEFDKNLFDVRKLYKRPDDDKIRQEEINKVKDAIDRCIDAYRKIKQDLLDEQTLEENERRRLEEIIKRGEAFRKQRDSLGINIGQIVLENEAFKAFRFKDKIVASDGLVYNKKEVLDFNDKDLSNIIKSIEEWEKSRHDVLAYLPVVQPEQDEEEEYYIPMLDLSARAVATENRRKDNAKSRSAVKTGKNLLLNDLPEGFVDNREDRSATAPREPDMFILRQASNKAKGRRIALIDEDKVQVGETPVNIATANNLLDSSFGEQKAKLGNLSRSNTSSRKKTANIVKNDEFVPILAENDVENATKNIDVLPVDIDANINNGEVAGTPSVESAENVVEEVKKPARKPRKKKAEPEYTATLTDNKIESKLNLAGIKAPVNVLGANEILDSSFGEQKANLGDLSRPNSNKNNVQKHPKKAEIVPEKEGIKAETIEELVPEKVEKVEMPTEEKPVENVEETPTVMVEEQPVEEVKKPARKPRAKKTATVETPAENKPEIKLNLSKKSNDDMFGGNNMFDNSFGGKANLGNLSKKNKKAEDVTVPESDDGE